MTETAAEMVPCDQPNSSCSGSIITLGAARNAAAPTSATNATAATHQARWTRGKRFGGFAGGRRSAESENVCVTGSLCAAHHPPTSGRKAMLRKNQAMEGAGGLRRSQRVCVAVGSVVLLMGAEHPDRQDRSGEWRPSGDPGGPPPPESPRRP
ncbi:hypothetical protein GCM10022205_01700 [Spinactinospora alkalitolerans]